MSELAIGFILLIVLFSFLASGLWVAMTLITVAMLGLVAGR